MSKYLVIVESPSKCKTIGKYLGEDYKVLSSKGHIRDLSTKGKYGLGVNIEENFKPDYITIKGKKKVIDELKKNLKDAEKVFLATDPDREGEAISWHLNEVLKPKKYERVVFNEITKNAILEAFKNPRQIDNNLVNSQETRRILDRIIGFRLSNLIKRKTSGTSAGRVQSVALKLIVDKEREIEAFKVEEYYTIKALFDDFEALLFNYNHEDIKITTSKEADDILNKLDKNFKIDNIEKKEKAKKLNAPFITSTLQQLASSKLNFTAKKTMSIAQKLYEGIEIDEGPVGLITYMRTDSVRLSNDFVSDTKNYIKNKYGSEYVGNIKVNKKKDNVQDAHEAIRPTSILRTPESIKNYLSNDEYKLYRLIYYRTLAYLMSDAKTLNTTIILDNNNYKFKTTGQIITFDGYLKVYSDYEEKEETILPSFEQYMDNKIISNEILKEQHFTKPPARYTEAKLIKEMEELGIGRPSTYVTIMDTIKTRKYVEVIEKKFKPTEIGIEITDKLQEFFSSIINIEYTANMENDLDSIALGNLVWYNVLDTFYDKFEPIIDEAFKEMEKVTPKTTGELCPNCNSDLVIRRGKYGMFTACSNYPECKYIKQDKKEEIEIIKCPNCDGKIILKKTKKGKDFYGCNNFPKCKTAYWDKPIGELCPNCNEMLVEKNNKIKCSKCEYEKV